MAQTMKDIARMAGVCIGTVSRVINNKDKVDPATRRRIMKLVEQTGYRPNVLGRNLALQRTHNIMVELFNIADLYCASLVKKITAECRQRGYRTLAGDCDYDLSIEAEYLRRVGDGHVDGLIISPLPGAVNAPLYAALVKSGFPLVLMDLEVPKVKANCVKYDDVGGALLAMDYLFNRGHHAIAFCGSHMEFPTVKDRLAGYREAHVRRAFAARPELILGTSGDHGRTDLQAGLEGLMRLKKGPTAILAENDIMAIRCIHTLQRMGVRVPEELAVVSFGAPAATALLPMPLTNISLHEGQAAQRAVELLIELIEQPSLREKPARKIVIEPELVLGQSA